MRSTDRPKGQTSRTFVEAARRKQFVACAVEVIAELGYARASLAEVARRAGVSKSLLLYHFAGKDELVDEVVRTVYHSGGEFMEERLREDLPPREWLQHYIKVSVQFVQEHRGAMIALGEIFVSRRTREGSNQFSGVTGEPVRHVSTQLRRGQKEGAFREFSVPVLARAIRSALNDVAGAYGADPAVDLRSWADELATAFDLATRA